MSQVRRRRILNLDSCNIDARTLRRRKRQRLREPALHCCGGGQRAMLCGWCGGTPWGPPPIASGPGLVVCPLEKSARSARSASSRIQRIAETSPRTSLQSRRHQTKSGGLPQPNPLQRSRHRAMDPAQTRPSYCWITHYRDVAPGVTGTVARCRTDLRIAMIAPASTCLAPRGTNRRQFCIAEAAIYEQIGQFYLGSDQFIY